jgi:serine/threonine protein kinase
MSASETVLARGRRVLSERYELVRGPLQGFGGSGEAWLALDDDEESYLVKVWRYETDEPELAQRGLWDRELRTLYRLGSSPGADESLLTIRDAGVDRTRRCFAMVLAGRGYDPLSAVLSERRDVPWLATNEARARLELWEALERLADGLHLLHRQQVIHRTVSAASVFLSRTDGPRSFRLGGFEWSVRLAAPAAESPPVDWSTPPEFLEQRQTHIGFGPGEDWFGFGMLAARCMLELERFATNPPDRRYEAVVRELERARPPALEPLESELLLRLLARDPRDRVARYDEIRESISDIINGLQRGFADSSDQAPLILAIRHNDESFTDRLVEAGFQPDPEKPEIAYDDSDPGHIAALKRYVTENFRDAQLHVVVGQNYYLLVGAEFDVAVGQLERVERATGETTHSWDAAFAIRVDRLRFSQPGLQPAELPAGSIEARTLREIRTDTRFIHVARSWERVLPRSDPTAALRINLAQFRDFVRCTNQLELLIRDSEIFPYRVVGRRQDAPGSECIEIVEAERRRPVPEFCKLDRGLTGYLQTEVESGKPDCDLVVLTGEQSGADSLQIPWVDLSARWRVLDIDHDARTVVLQRPAISDRSGAPEEGFVRTSGMFGQVSLINRRKSAIDRLDTHSYLLRSLVEPRKVAMDTGEVELPVALPATKVDEAKRATAADILRGRPIYALQGPPGTGKTTLVAWLLREILADDPVAQVLVTAQAHGAVDVLREKVRTEAFADVAEDRQPLAVRLYARGDNRASDDPGSVDNVALELLLRSRRALTDSEEQLTELEQAWASAAGELASQLRTQSPGGAGFTELVKRSANLTYCTTSAGGLEALTGAQSFDWSIVEEAGKAHGFDLALPLQAGHRWLLIGDQFQLPPYRFKDYQDALLDLHIAVQALNDLHEPGNLIDRDWLRSWAESSAEEQAAFIGYASDWLRTFEKIIDGCKHAHGEERLTLTEPVGAAAGLLSGQHRMHPDIGDLISRTYYKSQLISKTLVDGRVKPELRHPFSALAAVGQRAIVWLDLLPVELGGVSEEGGTPGRPRYTNAHEARAIRGFLRALHQSQPGTPGFELAVLAPYTQQVLLLNRELRRLPEELDGLELKRLRGQVSESTGGRIAHTVDSFQGNEAQVVVVSLTRNNTLPELGALGGSTRHGLGFLDEAPRLNVLLSRAEQLLVLVGSWDFFTRQLENVDLEDVNHPVWHWKKVLSTLSGWFDSGRAVRIDGEPFALQESFQ